MVALWGGGMSKTYRKNREKKRKKALKNNRRRDRRDRTVVVGEWGVGERNEMKFLIKKRTFDTAIPRRRRRVAGCSLLPLVACCPSLPVMLPVVACCVTRRYSLLRSAFVAAVSVAVLSST